MVYATMKTHKAFGGHAGSADKFNKFTLWKAGTLDASYHSTALIKEFNRMAKEEE